MIQLYRPPIAVKRLKKTLLILKSCKEQVKALIQWRDSKGAKVNCPLTSRAWLGFASKETLLNRELHNMSVHLPESSTTVEEKKATGKHNRASKPATVNTPVLQR